MRSGRFVLAGGSGFLGQVLAADLATRGHGVVVLTRSPRETSGAIRYVAWDGKALGDWAESLDGAEAVVNLAGRSVNTRYTPESRREIIASRVIRLTSSGGQSPLARPNHEFGCRQARWRSTATRGTGSATRVRRRARDSQPTYASCGREPSTRSERRRRGRSCCGSASRWGGKAAHWRRWRGCPDSGSAAPPGAASSTSASCI